VILQNAPELLPFEEQLVTSLKEMADSQVRLILNDLSKPVQVKPAAAFINRHMHCAATSH